MTAPTIDAGFGPDDKRESNEQAAGPKAIPLTIRPYQPADEDAVVDLWKRCKLVASGSDPRADIQRKLTVQPELFLVGTLLGKVVATAMAGDDGHRAYLYYLAVAPEHQRRGYGRKMVTQILNLLRERGCPKLNLFVSLKNPQVIAFYEHLGFKQNQMVSLGRRFRG